MSRKTKESPLNLIRILPPKEGGPRPNKYNPASTHFKLKLDGEEASRPLLSLGGLVGFFDALFGVIGKIGTWMLHQIQRVVHLIAAGFETVLLWFSQGTSQISQLGKSIGRQIFNPAKSESVGGQSPGHQLWAETALSRKPLVSEPMQRDRSKQREMLIEEVHALRTQLTTHQDELIRVTAQMEELKALVLSQQQVLLHLGKELEATEKQDTARERLPARKTNPRGSNPSKSESSDPLPTTQFEFGPPHH